LVIWPFWSEKRRKWKGTKLHDQMERETNWSKKEETGSIFLELSMEDRDIWMIEGKRLLVTFFQIRIEVKLLSRKRRIDIKHDMYS